jgi:sugar O-acyltransferase (sialic acid O-acetyltransferase NeuD family)
MDRLVIWGATGQAIVLEELLYHYSIKIDAFFENNIHLPSPIENVPIYRGEDGFLTWLKIQKNINTCGFLIAIGGNNGNARVEIGKKLKLAGLLPYTAIHKTAFVAYNSVIGEGCQILANSTVCARVKIGEYCIINTAASVDHECVLEEGVHIGPGAKLAGCVEVKKGSFIGANATILPRLTIGENAIIGAGAVITKNVTANSIMVGNPAKKIEKK